MRVYVFSVFGLTEAYMHLFNGGTSTVENIVMKEEYSFTLTIPLADIDEIIKILNETRQIYPQVRISRKSDRKECARYYLSFPLTASRFDLKFHEWFKEQQQDSWEVFGPTYGRWGFT